MKILNLRATVSAVLALALALLPFGGAPAQTVTALPVAVNSNAVTDLGNGPQEVRVLQGNVGFFTSSGSGLGSTSGSATLLTLTATAAANPPCVGCIISATGITSGTTVTAFNGTTGVTLSAAMTVAASTPVAWGVACPSTPGAQALAQASVGGDLPFYTQARLCASGNLGPGALVLPFAIGSH